MMAGVLLACFFPRTGLGEDQPDAFNQPNVIVVMADDLGIGDISPTNPAARSERRICRRWPTKGSRFSTPIRRAPFARQRDTDC